MIASFFPSPVRCCSRQAGVVASRSRSVTSCLAAVRRAPAATALGQSPVAPPWAALGLLARTAEALASPVEAVRAVASAGAPQVQLPVGPEARAAAPQSRPAATA